MAIVKKKAVFRDWSGGHWGALDSFSAPTNQYRAINMQLYDDGSVGPRPGFKRLVESSGTPPSPVSGANNEVFGAVWVPKGFGVDNGYLFFVSGNTAAASKRFDLKTLTWAATAIGTINDANNQYPRLNEGCFAYANPSKLVLKATTVYDVGADTTSTITYPDSFTPDRSVFYKARHYAWGDTAFPNRVYYSNADAYTTFVSGQYFNIGSGGSAAADRPIIKQAWVLRDALLFLVFPVGLVEKMNYAEWWLLSGESPQAGATLRRVLVGPYPTFREQVAQFNDQLLWLDMQWNAGITLNDGAKIDTKALAHLKQSRSSGLYAPFARQACVTYGRPAVILPYAGTAVAVETTGENVGNFDDYGMQAWELVNGVWTKSLWWGGGVADGRYEQVSVVVPFEGNKMLVMTNIVSDLSGAFRTYSRDICLNRPSNTADSWSDPNETNPDITDTDDLVCQLWLPEIMEDDGSPIRIRRVTVDFNYWKESTYVPASTADITVRLKGHSLEEGSDVLGDTKTSNSSRLDATSNNYPKRARHVFRFPESGYFGSQQIRFTSVRNCAIFGVEVEYEVNTKAPS